MPQSDNYRNKTYRVRAEIASWSEKKAREQKKIADLNNKIGSAIRAMQSSKSMSTINSKRHEVVRYQNDLVKIKKSIADIETKIAKKNKELDADLKKFDTEELKESKKRQTELDAFQRKQTQTFNQMNQTLRTHENAIVQLQSLPEKITVLFLASNPRDQEQLNLDEEVRSIKDMISKAKHRDSVKLESCWAVRPGDILQSMNEFEPTIVHFSGHGSDADKLVLMDNQQQTKLVSLDAIVQAMSVANDNLKLVFFNTCFSETQAKKVVEHIDAAIGMRTSISDDAARIFSSHFYSSISFGHSIAKAFGQAKAALMLEGVKEESIPQLFTKIDAEDLYIVAK
ncbi:MAG: CHAT domain-containing protein [Bifidobacteriaceae bacterium]|jgi:hypothetical protein|nr:CHAT domain-containing protein [Bifidobacteriaceae bacterium]